MPRHRNTLFDEHVMTRRNGTLVTAHMLADDICHTRFIYSEIQPPTTFYELKTAVEEYRADAVAHGDPTEPIDALLKIITVASTSPQGPLPELPMCALEIESAAAQENG